MNLSAQEAKMARSIVKSNVQTILPAANLDIRPDVGEDWNVRLFADDVKVGVVPGQVPQLDVSIIDSTGLGPSNLLRGAEIGNWFKNQSIPISYTNYLRVNNPGVGPAVVGYSAEVIRDYGQGAGSIVVTDVQQIAAGLALLVRPPVGQDWVISAFGSDQWIGKSPAGFPNLRVDLTDGTNTAVLMHPTEDRYWTSPVELYVNHDNYINIVNASGVQAEVSFTAEIHRDYGAAGNSIVRSQLVQCAILGTQTFRPPDGEEWQVTGFGAEHWFGISPLMNPDIGFAMWDGTNESPIADRVNAYSQLHDTDLKISYSDYLRVTDTSSLVNDVGISAVLIRKYK